MRRLIFLGSLIYGLVLLGLATLRGELLILIIPLVVYLGTGLFFGPGEPRLKITRTLSSDRISQGSPVAVELSVTNEGDGLERVLIEDLFPPALLVVEGEPRVVTSLQAGETIAMTYSLLARRGYHSIPGVRLTASDSLGLFRRQVTIACEARLRVLPRVDKIRRLPIRPQRTRPFVGLVPAHRGGPGVEFFGLREYQMGDPLRWVNWKACARYQRIVFTNEYEQECVADIGLILDIRRRGYVGSGEDSLFEHAIQATAALAETFLDDGNRVGLLLFGSLVNWTFPGYGKLQRERILRALADVEPGDYVDRLEYLPTRLFPAQSQLVLVSPLLREDLRVLVRLRARGYPVLVISPDPVAFEEGRHGPEAAAELAVRIARLERELLIRKLRRAGVHVVDWAVHKPLNQAVYASVRRASLWFRATGLRATR